MLWCNPFLWQKETCLKCFIKKRKEIWTLANYNIGANLVSTVDSASSQAFGSLRSSKNCQGLVISLPTADLSRAVVSSWSREHCGSVVECQSDLCCVVSLSKTLYSPKVLVIPRKRWPTPDMTDKLLTGMFTSTQTGKQFLVEGCALSTCWPLRLSLPRAAPVAEWVRSLYFSALNHSIISPLCLV